MATYIIASRPNSLYMAEIQALAEFLSQNAAGVRIQTVIKHASEWPQFSQSVCRAYGFPLRCCPIVFTLEGRLIGSASSFLEEIKIKYGKIMSLPQETLKKRASLNVKSISQEMRRKHHGITLNQRAEKTLSQAKDKEGIIKLLNTTLLSKQAVNGVTLFTRTTEQINNERNIVGVLDQDIEILRDEPFIIQQDQSIQSNASKKLLSISSQKKIKTKDENSASKELLADTSTPQGVGSQNPVETPMDPQIGGATEESAAVNNNITEQPDESKKKEQEGDLDQEEDEDQQDEEDRTLNQDATQSNLSTLQRKEVSPPPQDQQVQVQQEQESFNIKIKDFSISYTFNDFVQKYGKELKSKKPSVPNKLITSTTSSITKSRVGSKNDSSRIGTGLKSKLLMDDTARTKEQTVFQDVKKQHQESIKGKERGQSRNNKSKYNSKVDLAQNIRVFHLLPAKAGFLIDNALIVTQFQQQYLLCVHPRPVIDGQFMIVQPEDAPIDSQFTFKDYGLFKRKQCGPKVMRERRDHSIQAAQQQQEKLQGQSKDKISSFKVGGPRGTLTNIGAGNSVSGGRQISQIAGQQSSIDINMTSVDPMFEIDKSFMSSLEVDNKAPLSQYDWKFWFQAVVDCQGVGFLQLLPVGAQSSSFFQSKVMNMIPLKTLLKELKLDFLPLDRYIQNRVEFLVREKERQFQDTKQASRAQKNPFFVSRITTIDEFDFTHAIYVYESTPNEKALKNGFVKCYQSLNDGAGSFKETGMTIILHQKFLFVAPLIRPYTIVNERDVYINPMAYLGIFTFPIIQKEWPQTAGINQQNFEPLEILKLSSKHS